MFNQKEYMKEYYIKNKERIKESRKGYNKQYYERNKEKYKKYKKQHHEYYSNYMKEYRKDNIKRIRKWYRERDKNKRKIDLKYNLNGRMKTAIRLALKNNKNGKHWEDLVGYTLKDLYKRLKKTLPKGYDWNDFLEGKLHIDHIVPRSAFNFSKSEHIDFKRCWALDNLQLLLARENIAKGAKLTKPFQPALQL